MILNLKLKIFNNDEEVIVITKLDVSDFVRQLFIPVS